MSELIVNEKPLTTTEQDTLAELEQVIADNFLGFVAVGKALAEIRDKQLYRTPGGRTFEAYCKELWDVCESRAYQLMDGAQVIENLHNCGENLKCLPMNEAQARELARLNQGEQQLVWQEVVDQAGNGKITAKKVKAAVQEFKGEQLNKQIRKATGERRKNRKEFMSPEFAEAWEQLWNQVELERQANWRTTSRQTVHKHTSMLLEAVAEAGPKELKKVGVSMELTNREKLDQAGFRIFRIRPSELVIEEWCGGNEWMVATTCDTPTELSDRFKELMEEPNNIRA